ncbi:hypothetical protein WH87_08450 [Devosia epidermidihirudinis]|uniref:Uncharacterized protein n=1 Tax=Devosia epidermidihirudinis TaxID=1293439 RepID=A0A0F5QAJ0_9HYPH|nr:hypothetical protein [Devosia epidermidihirudinis]KKC37733.1 hypothetical protein WH87_08450 [Devosia epidermidihirudinis]
MKRFFDLIVNAANRDGAVRRAKPAAHHPAHDKVAPDCAIWNDISRALDISPRDLVGKTKSEDTRK